MTPAEYRSLKPKKVSKYRNEKGKVDGLKFDSLKEKKRYGQLKMREKAGEIRALRMQHSFPIVVNGVKICEYRSDFDYSEIGAGQDGMDKWIVEDCKGFKTPAYIMKKKLLRAVWGIEILET
jgi:Protein of unknown function (DUF1064)